MGSLSAIYNNYQPYNSILNTFSLAADFSAFAVTYLKPSDDRAATYVVAVYDLVNTDPNYSSSTSAIVPLETISAAYITNPA